MKKILFISFLGIVLVSLAACDNQKNEQIANTSAVKEFKDGFIRSCTASGAVLEFCECTYSKVTAKYSEKELINTVTSKNKASMEKLSNDIKSLAIECLN